MGTIAARDAIRVLTLTEQVAAACLFAAVQALEIRRRHGNRAPARMEPAIRKLHDDVLTMGAFVEEDRPLEPELRRLTAAVAERRWSLYGAEP